MHADLVKERTTMTKLWSKREMQIQSVLASTAGMYGDLQGIAGQAIETIDALDISRLTATAGMNIGQAEAVKSSNGASRAQA